MQKTKKFKFIAVIAAIILCLPLALCLAACAGNQKQVNTNSKEMYALSAMSSVMYFQQEQSQVAVAKNMSSMSLEQSSTSQPESITDEDLSGTKNCIIMFGEIIKNNGFTQTVEKKNIHFNSQTT